MKLNVTYLGHGEFDVVDLDSNKRYFATASTERDGKAYDDPVYWIDVTVTDMQGNKVEELEEEVLSELENFEDEAFELEFDSDCGRGDAWADAMQDR